MANDSGKFWCLTPEESVEILKTDQERGLSPDEAARRLAAYGRNEIGAKKNISGFRIFLNQLASPLILILIVAGGVMLAVAEYGDALFIFAAVIVNSILGFYQEHKAERALAELKTYLKQRARVVRDGKDREMDAEEIVPGDVIRLAQGDRVPADGRVLFANDFQADESVLTGESLPVAKSREPVAENASIADQESMVFAGTLVTQGVATVVACRTGKQTEIGNIASLIASAESEKTPLQRAIGTFSFHLSILLCILTAAVFAVGLIAGYSGIDMFLISVAIAVSAIPEGLPISLTVILAVGVERMARRKGVVRKLVAAEALGSTTVILTDKTGTLTMAKMVLSKVIPLREEAADRLLAKALLNAGVLIENPEDHPEAWRINGRIMEVALARSAGLKGISAAEILDKRSVLQSQPFNAVQKFSASLVKGSGGYFVVCFGAPDILLARSTLSDEQRKERLAEIDALASSGERVLGVATKDVQNIEGFSFAEPSCLSNLAFDGLIAFRDPIRPGIREVIREVHDAGIRTVIMTGDHRGTAVAVAREVGFDVSSSSVLDASELALLSESELRTRLPDIRVVSRVTPFDKLRIAKLYQEAGEVVAMTGDGVNDAPSIKQADIGIAMGSGTEVAQSVADLVLLDDNFETIVAAVEEGRQIFGNIRKVVVYLLSNVADGLILIGGSLAFGLPLPLNALQILWVNFFTDSFPAVSFAFEKETGVLSQPPRGSREGLFDPLMKFLVVGIGILTSALLFASYYTLLRLGYDLELVQTFTFAAFGTYTLLLALSVRSLDKSIFSYPLFSNHYLTSGIAVGLGLMAVAIYVPALQTLFGTVPLSLPWVLGVILIGAVSIALVEAAKLWFRKSRK